MEERIKSHMDLDVHSDRISVATAGPCRAPGRLIGKVMHDVVKLLRVMANIGTPEQLHSNEKLLLNAEDRALRAWSLHNSRSRSRCVRLHRTVLQTVQKTLKIELPQPRFNSSRNA